MIDLATLIANVESNDNQYALRFEPHVYQRAVEGTYAGAVDAAKAANKCSRATACIIIATSWGAWQIMGFNLYGPLKLQPRPIGKYLGDRTMQEQSFDMFLQTNGLTAWSDMAAVSDDDLLAFAKRYNGPGAPTEYMARMKEILAYLEAKKAQMLSEASHG